MPRSSAETSRITGYYLQMRHGEAVEVEYVDLADADAQARFPTLLAAIEERHLPYPLVAVNDRLRLAGSAAYYQVLPLVEQALETENIQPEM
jgi:disulfide oxidoreductase YuzD